MIDSMTGFGGVQRVVDGVEHALEIRSVNNRYFKSVIRLPDGMQFAEPEIEKALRSRLVRGSVTINLRMRNATATAAYDVNTEALSRYASAMMQVELPDGVRATIDLATLSNLPGVCQVPSIDESRRAEQVSLILEMTEAALDHVIAMRAREGQALHNDLVGHCGRLGSELDRIVGRAPVVLEDYRERLVSRVEALMSAGKFELESDALCREVALYADRSDISEEIARLRAHIDHFSEICDSGDAVGRKLDFITQEMLRETNTIGSKSGDGAISRSVVEMKALIDRIKEQVQNVE